MRILVIEDEAKVSHALKEGLERAQYEVLTTRTGEEGFYLASTQSFDLVLLDLMLPGRDGLEILSTLRTRGWKTPVMILTARDAVQFDGQPIGGMAPGKIVAAGIAMVPEGRRLFPSLSVEENLLLGAYTKRPGPWNVDAVFQLFPILREKRAVPSTSLSGGQQQMVAIGRGLMANPKLLI